MAQNNNPSMVTDGLIFYYDMYNTLKSYAGPPTTNLITNPNDFTTAAWAKSFCNIAFAPDVPAPYTPRDSQRSCIMTETIDNNQHLLYQAPVVSIGQVYTLSIYAKARERKQIALVMFGEGYSVFDLAAGNIYQTGGNTCTITPVGDGWYYCTATITKTNATGGVFVGIWNNAASYAGVAGYGLYISKFQYELNPYPTPYCNPVRTTTQVLTDVASATAMTATSLTYNSNNTFSFNGTTDLIACGNVFGSVFVGLTAKFSVTAWVKPSSATMTNNYIIGKWATTAGQWILRVGDATTHNRANFFWSNPGNSAYINQSATVAITDTSKWYHLTGVYDITLGATNSMKIYVDGIDVSTYNENNVGTPTNIDATAAELVIGNRLDATRGFSGAIASTSIYSRALSPSEVYQNFAALRGKYGV